MERNNRGDSSRGTRSTSGRGGGSRYEYQKRDATSMKKRGEQSGSDFDKILSEDVTVFTPNDGNNFIRFLPPTWKNPEHFGMDIYVHYGVGPDNQTYLCLHKMKGEACPICEEHKRAVDDNDDEYAKKLKPNKRVLVYLIDRDNEKEGLQAWSMPWTFDRDVCKVSVDKRTGETLELDNPEEGYDIEFEKKGQKMKTEYLGIAVARRTSELGNDKWLEQAIDKPLDTILVYKDYDYIQNIFGGGSKGGKEADLDKEQERGLRESEDRGRREQKNAKSQDQEYDWVSVHGMTYDEMCAVIDDQKLDIDPEKSKDDADLADWVCEEMKIKDEPKTERTSRGRSAAPAKEEEESPRDKVRRMREERDR